MTERYQRLSLGEPHLPLRGVFSCGEEVLDRHLRERARKEMEQRVAAVWILHDTHHDRIAGYYTLSAVAVERAELPPSLTHRWAHYEVYPATLLGRLAVDRDYQGRRLGARLLLDALARALGASRQVASVAVLTDAKHDAAQSFYERYGFQLLSTEQSGRRLFIPMRSIEELFAE